MPFAPRIRKDVLKAFDEDILPALWKPQLSIGYVAPPFSFPEGIKARLTGNSVPRASTADPGYPIQTYWPKPQLHATFHPYIGFIYQGAADEHTLVNSSEASKNNISKGIYAIRWQAPSVLIFPVGVARNTGLRPYWDGPEPPPPMMRILWMGTIGSELFMHTHIEIAGKPIEISHSLQMHDSNLIALNHLFIEEMKCDPVNGQSTAQAILLSIALRMERRLRENFPPIANTSHPPTSSQEAILINDGIGNPWHEAVIYIQLHLHEQISLRKIAREVSISPPHLNRLFHRFSGVSTMRYVQLQRIAAAKKILAEGPENISEIASLLNFKRTNAFCSAFRKETGLTPNQYRRQSRQQKNAF